MSSSPLRQEIDHLAAAKGYRTEWNDQGCVLIIDPNNPKYEALCRANPELGFVPDFLARTALLPLDHPEACELRPGTAPKHGPKTFVGWDK